MNTLTMKPHEKVLEAVGEIWGIPTTDLFPQDLTMQFPLFEKHQVFRVSSRERDFMYVAIQEKGAPLIFQRKQADANLTALNTLLDAEGINPALVMTPEELALIVRTLLWEPFGFVGTQAFLAEQKERGFQGWIPPGLQDGPQRFETHCQDPELEHHDEGWTLTFSFFNAAGGVERWRVQGDDASLKEATKTQAEEDRTFRYPLFL